MTRVVKLLLWTPVVLVAAVIIGAYSGVAAPMLTRSQIPVDAPVAFAGLFVLIVAAGIGTAIVNRRAWKAAGQAVGLTPDGFSLSSSPALSGTVSGRPVLARTYSTGSSGDHGSKKTYTVVEASLERPVDWWGTFASAEVDGTGNMAEVDHVDTLTVDGEVHVWGDVDKAVVEDVLTPEVRRTLEGVDSLSVGDIQQNMVGALHAELDTSEGSMAGTVAKGVLRMAGGGEPTGPSKTVGHRSKGVIRDEAELQRQVDAVTTVAAAIDHEAPR